MNKRPALSEISKRPEFFAGCADVATRLLHAADAGEVAALLAEAGALLGADAAAFASFVKDDEAYESYRFILACDATWCLEYESGACYMHDPWLQYVRHHAEPVLAENIRARTDQERAVVDLERRYGFASAVIVPAQAPHGLTRLAALCLGSEMPGYFNDDGLPAVTFAAAALALRLHEWQIGQLRQELLEHTRLSDEDIVLLQFQRQGHGSKQIARATNSSPMSVDSRWQRLNAKLGVSSRVAAANLAAEYGLL
jgi:DNA-binding CsgD family transcriptional regulator